MRDTQHRKMIQARSNELLRAVNALLAAVAAAPAPCPAPAAVRGKRGAGGPTKHADSIRRGVKAHWDSMSKAQREARIRKMLAGRGLERKPKKKPTARSLALRKSIKAHWDSMPPAAREARIRKMLKARGLQRRAPA